MGRNFKQKKSSNMNQVDPKNVSKLAEFGLKIGQKRSNFIHQNMLNQPGS